MTYIAHAYVASVNILELPCAYACAYACTYRTSENQAKPFRNPKNCLSVRGQFCLPIWTQGGNFSQIKGQVKMFWLAVNTKLSSCRKPLIELTP